MTWKVLSLFEWLFYTRTHTCTRALTHFLVHFLLMVCPSKKQLFRFGAVKLEGISTCGCYLVKRLFSFSGLSSFSVPHHTVRWPQKLSQGDDMQAPLRPGSFTCHLGRYRLLCRMTWQKPRPSSRLEGLSRAHDAWAVLFSLWLSPSSGQEG